MFDVVADRANITDIQTRGIGNVPVLVALPREDRARIAAPHRDDDVGGLDDLIGPPPGQPIRDVVTVNGIRIMLEDGTWGLVRASSNKPELVVVVESPASEANMRAIFAELDAHLSTYPEIGEYNQKI